MWAAVAAVSAVPLLAACAAGPVPPHATVLDVTVQQSSNPPAGSLLGAADLPSGWVPTGAADGGLMLPECLQDSGAMPSPARTQVAAYARAEQLPALQEVLYTYRSHDAAIAFTRIVAAFRECPHTSLSVAGQRSRVPMVDLPVRPTAAGVRAWSTTVLRHGVMYRVAVALVRRRDQLAFVAYADRSNPAFDARLGRIMSAVSEKL